MANGKFSDKVVLITGGNSGIGLGCAKAFAAAGAQVVITGRNQQSLAQAAQDIGHGTVALRSDVGQMKDIANLAETVGKQFGRIDVLFANAGVGTFLPITETTEADWDECFSINLKGVYFLVQKTLPWMHSGATIVFNASVGATKMGPTSAIYSTTKAGVRTLGRALAVELAPRGIRVNILSPGPIDTPLPHHTKGIPPEKVSDFVDHLSRGTALKRMGRPEEVAAAVLFLASEESSYVVGAELVVDGGLLCM